ncbi:glycoside hydrolase family 20 zincin-like fold domain-containing protein, partial [Aquiflexum sp.]|uniref:glycoside hydrolase family 20 zincin-like fold domain-containing protein n=1 Tax=Aquiflexum sp. TaxID=1872584 RepID=UPI003592EE6F
MKKLIIGLFSFLVLGLGYGFSQSVYVLYDADLSQAKYANKIMREALISKGYKISENRTQYDFLLNLDVNAVNLDKESYRIIPDRKTITINGGDANGLLYGCLSLREKINNGIKLHEIVYEEEKPEME